MSTKEEEIKLPRIKKVPLMMGLIFIGLGLWNLVLVFISSESMKPTYSTLVIAFLGFGITLLDKSGVFER